MLIKSDQILSVGYFEISMFSEQVQAFPNEENPLQNYVEDRARDDAELWRLA